VTTLFTFKVLWRHINPLFYKKSVLSQTSGYFSYNARTLCLIFSISYLFSYVFLTFPGGTCYQRVGWDNCFLEYYSPSSYHRPFSDENLIKLKMQSRKRPGLSCHLCKMDIFQVFFIISFHRLKKCRDPPLPDALLIALES